MNHIQLIRPSFNKRHVCRQRPKKLGVFVRSIHRPYEGAGLNPQFFPQGRSRVSRHNSVPLNAHWQGAVYPPDQSARYSIS